VQINPHLDTYPIVSPPDFRAHAFPARTVQPNSFCAYYDYELFSYFVPTHPYFPLFWDNALLVEITIFIVAGNLKPLGGFQL
jgi:hypothetical protein